MLIVHIKGFVVIINLRHIRVGKYFAQHLGLATNLWGEGAIIVAHPAAIPFGLIFPIIWVARAGFSLYIIEPGILGSLARGPYIFTGY